MALLGQILELMKIESGSRGKKPVTSFKCGKPGHYKPQCPKLKTKQGNNMRPFHGAERGY